MGESLIFQLKVNLKNPNIYEHQTFRTEKIGQMRLSEGYHKLVFLSGSNFKEGALLDLREIRLVQVE